MRLYQEYLDVLDNGAMDAGEIITALKIDRTNRVKVRQVYNRLGGMMSAGLITQDSQLRYVKR